jgi:hypothetical protein
MIDISGSPDQQKLVCMIPALMAATRTVPTSPSFEGVALGNRPPGNAKSTLWPGGLLLYFEVSNLGIAVRSFQKKAAIQPCLSLNC